MTDKLTGLVAMIEEYRLASELSIEALCQRIAITPDIYSYWRKINRVSKPKLKTLKAIASILDMTLEQVQGMI